MTKNTKFETDNFTRGGQLLSHKFRMFFQNLRVVLKWSLWGSLAGFVVGFLVHQPSFWLLKLYFVHYLGGWLKILFWHDLIQPFCSWTDSFLRLMFHGSPGIASAHLKFWQLLTEMSLPNGSLFVMRTVKFLKDPRILALVSQVEVLIWWAIGFFCATFCVTWYTFWSKSRNMEELKILEGNSVSALSHIASRIYKEGPSLYNVAPGLPYPKDGENKHTAIMGATRTGKTTCIIHLLDQVRARGDRAVILDATGEFTRRYYRDGQDHLINPKDPRSLSWNIWNEQLDVYGYKAWADSFVPESKGDPIWYLSARRLLAETAQLMTHDPERSMKKLLHIACNQALDEDLMDFYKNSSVESLVNKESEKQTMGIRLQLSSYINAFGVLRDDEGPSFSVLNWVKENKRKDEWLFLLSTPTQRATLAPFVASMFNFAFLGLEGAGVDFKNRLWMVTDEIAGWGIPITALKRMVTEGAKYGACCVLGFQNKSQTDELYSHAGTKIISSNCNTKIMFRSPDSETAYDLSQNMGTQEVLLPSEGFSLGAHHMRDGVNLSSQRRIQSVVSSNDIMRREDLTAYVQLPGNYPIVEVQYDRLGR